MRMHVFRHVPFEDEAAVGQWAREHGCSPSATDFHAGQLPPSPESHDWLVVMGGPMGVHDHQEHPWLLPEIEAIRASIERGVPVLGICLGAQLIATALGATVQRNPFPEIGWFEIATAPEAREHPLLVPLPDTYTAFHWHGDTFALPPGATPLGASQACASQGFAYGDRVLALQFHLESTPESIEALIRHCGHEITPGPFVQSAEQMRTEFGRIQDMRPILHDLLAGLLRGLEP